MVEFLSIVRITGMDLGLDLTSLAMWAFLSFNESSVKLVVMVLAFAVFCVIY